MINEKDLTEHLSTAIQLLMFSIFSRVLLSHRSLFSA